jgi:hypothetical protein
VLLPLKISTLNKENYLSGAEMCQHITSVQLLAQLIRSLLQLMERLQDFIQVLLSLSLKS